MILIKPDPDARTIKSVFLNPVIYQMTKGDLDDIHTWEPPQNKRYVSIHLDNYKETLLGVASYNEVSPVLGEGHILIKPQYHNTAITVEAGKAFQRWLKVNTNYKTIITLIPGLCPHSMKYVEKLGFTACGNIPNGTVYNNILTSMFIFSVDLSNLED